MYWANGAPADGYELLFRPEQWVPFATINSVGEIQADNAGFAVDSCDVYLDGGKNLQGLTITVGCRGTNAYLFKVAFQVSLLGVILTERSPL